MTATERKGCIYIEHPHGPNCNKVCDPGENLCPHHKLLTSAAQVKTEAKTPRAYQE